MKKPEIPPEEEMPEYQMFPKGMWHMLAAIMLMIFSGAGVVILASRMIAPFMDVGTLSTTSFGAIVVMAFILSTPTFLLSRGWAKCHTFLLWLNALYLFLLAVGVGFFFLQADYGLALIGVIGVVFAGTARFLYNSRAYHAGVEYYRLIWAHYRAGTRRKSCTGSFGGTREMALEFGKCVIAVVVSLLPLLCVADAGNDPNAEELERMLSRDLAASTTGLGQRIEACEEKASTRDVPKLDADKVAELNAGREQLLTALSHLHFRNSFECARDSRETVAFLLGILGMVRDKLGGEADKPRQVREGLIYPSLEELRYQRKYEKLPEKLRLYLENEVGDEPFTLMKTLEKNNLLVDQ